MKLRVQYHMFRPTHMFGNCQPVPNAQLVLEVKVADLPKPLVMGSYSPDQTKKRPTESR